MKNRINATRSDPNTLLYRELSIRLSKEGIPVSLNTESRTVECIMATEAPCPMFDWNKGRVIPEVLLMSGVILPESRQVPLLDTHSRYDTSSVIGSTRNIRVDGENLVGIDNFSATKEAEGPWMKTAEGHLTDRSVGYSYSNEDALYVDAGETAVIDGREFTGPVKVVKKWRVKENSICPIGADENAKARAEQPNNDSVKTEKEQKMNKKLRAYLETQGLSPDATDEEAQRFLDGHEFKTPVEVDVDKERAEAARIEQERVSEIQTMCRDFDLDDLAADLVKKNTPIPEARQVVMEAHIKAKEKEDLPGYRVPYEVGLDAQDKFRAAAGDSLLFRTGMDIEKPAAGYDELTGMTLKELARESLRVAGERTGGNAVEMIGRAMTTSDFPLLLANTANKHLANGYETADETWKAWVATGSVSDFKAHTLNRISESSDLSQILEEGEYTYGKKTEAKETYQIATYGKMFALSRQTIINDDLNALSDIPAGHGEAAARKIGDIVYAVLTANAAMGDSVALFHADHSNYVGSGSGAAVGIATMTAGILAMKNQKDLQNLRRLNIAPKFILAPNAMEGTTEAFFGTDRFDAQASVDTKVNIYAGSKYTRIYEGRLDDARSTGWYLAGPKGKTVKAFFLNGVQTPYMETKQGWNVDGVEYKVRIDCGAKAVDWKTLYYNYGA